MAGLAALRLWVGARTGWRRYGLACVAGVAAAAAQTPWYAIPLLIPAFALLVWQLDGAAEGARRTDRAGWSKGAFAGARIGWAFGAGYFFLSVYWIGEAFLVDPARTGWLMPFAIGGLAAGLGLFGALAGGIYAAGVMRSRLGGPARVLVFAVVWAVLEWLRGWIFTGFPWSLAGYVWSPVLPVAQLASLTGVYGLSLLTVAAAAMPAVLAGPRVSRLAVAGTVVATVLAPLAVAAWGWARLAAMPAAPEVPGIQLALVQASIPQAEKWRPDLRVRNLERHLALSRMVRVRDDARLVLIWPEAAVPFYLANDASAREAVADVLPPSGVLVTGALRAEIEGGRVTRVWNSVLAIDAGARVLATYDKSHLVPFGEYIPFRGWLPIDRLVPGQGDITPGNGLETMRVDGIPAFSPLVCYEAIFPGAVADRNDRPAWLLNVTNDAWFGQGAGPKQHFAIARMRAIEEGLPLVRAANSGISAIVDPFGRILARLGLNEVGILEAALPGPLPPTLYARAGNRVFWALSALFLVAAIGFGRVRRAGAKSVATPTEPT